MSNGRIVLMFCSFSGPPNIVRLHGQGRVHVAGSAETEELLGHFVTEPLPGLRAIIDVQVERVSDSCGWAVPLLDFGGERDLLTQRNARRTEGELKSYWTSKNARSIDGLPGLPS